MAHLLSNETSLGAPGEGMAPFHNLVNSKLFSKTFTPSTSLAQGTRFTQLEGHKRMGPHETRDEED